MTNTTPKPIQACIDLWLRRRKAEGRKDLLRGKGIYALAHQAKKRGEEYFTQALIDEWYTKRATETPMSHYRRVTNTHSFLQYVLSRGYATFHLPPLPPRPRQTTIPFIPTDEELTNVFRATCELTDKEEEKDKDENQTATTSTTQSTPATHTTLLQRLLTRMELPVMLRLMLSSGLRPNEVRMLRKEDVDLETGAIHVINTKGYHEHKVVMHDTMLHLMLRYDSAVAQLLPGRKTFFPNDHDAYYGNTWLSEHFRRCWLKYNTALYDNGRTSCYMLRHVYATKNVNAMTSDDQHQNLIHLLALSRSMGHSTLRSTMYYFQLSASLATVMDKLTVKTFDTIIPTIEEEETDKTDRLDRTDKPKGEEQEENPRENKDETPRGNKATNEYNINSNTTPNTKPKEDHHDQRDQ